MKPLSTVLTCAIATAVSFSVPGPVWSATGATQEKSEVTGQAVKKKSTVKRASTKKRTVARKTAKSVAARQVTRDPSPKVIENTATAAVAAASVVPVMAVISAPALSLATELNSVPAVPAPPYPSAPLSVSPTLAMPALSVSPPAAAQPVSAQPAVATPTSPGPAPARYVSTPAKAAPVPVVAWEPSIKPQTIPAFSPFTGNPYMAYPQQVNQPFKDVEVALNDLNFGLPAMPSLTGLLPALPEGLSGLLPTIPEGMSILPVIKTVYPTGEKPLVILTFKCPTELIGITPLPTKALHDVVTWGMDALNDSNLLSFNMQQVCQ